MSSWIFHGLLRGILTTRYPNATESMPPAYRGAVVALTADEAAQAIGAEVCLSRAIHPQPGVARVDARRCFQCGECARRAPEAFALSNAFELASVDGDAESIRAKLRERVAALGRSIHLRHVDAGSDGSEEQELQAIFNPFYDANRLGIFLTATPRHADVLVVTGVVTLQMVEPLRNAYAAMPDPKIVVALGTSACSGGIFAGLPQVVGPVSSIVPVDVFIPGAPPSPLTILNGLWVALGRVKAQRDGGT